MDIDLLSRMVGELILDHDEVGLPGLGSFVAEIVPASFSDRGYTINPPYRRLSFHPVKNEQDLLVDLYAESNDVAREAARAILTGFLSEMKDLLISKKTIVFPGLGRLRATKENNFFFVCNENLDIYPGGFGLEPISLKNHVETAEEVSEVVSTLASIVSPTAEPVPAADTAEPSGEPAGLVDVAGEPAVEPVELIDDVDEPAVESVGAVAGIEEAAEDPVELVDDGGQTAPAPAPAPTPAPVPVAATAHPSPRSHSHSHKHRRKHKFLKIVAILFAIAAVAFAAFLILAGVAPDFIDSILYTPEELRILNY